jgi:hypothetical protein
VSSGWRASIDIFGAIDFARGILWYVGFYDNPSEKRGVKGLEPAEIGERLSSEHGRIPRRRLFSQPNLWRITIMCDAKAWCGSFI